MKPEAQWQAIPENEKELPTLMNSSIEMVPERSISEEKKTVWKVVGDRLILWLIEIITMIPDIR